MERETAAALGLQQGTALVVERLEAENERLRAALELTQYGFNHRRCPVCAGWDGTTERDKVHSTKCPVAQALC